MVLLLIFGILACGCERVRLETSARRVFRPRRRQVGWLWMRRGAAGLRSASANGSGGAAVERPFRRLGIHPVERCKPVASRSRGETNVRSAELLDPRRVRVYSKLSVPDCPLLPGLPVTREVANAAATCH